MKRSLLIIASVIAAVLPRLAAAQFVKGNEAVRVMPDGTKRVETPPTAGALLATPCPADRRGCGGGGWMMVETDAGLMECTEVYARAGTCRASTYGAQKLSRLWIVKTRGQWQQCQFPDLGSKCVSTKSLPISAVQ
jgi:hypothetical protein